MQRNAYILDKYRHLSQMGKVSVMTEQERKKKQLFKNLLEKMYEKGETESNISTQDLLKDMEVELRYILSSK